MTETFLDAWHHEEQQPFEGWDFSAYKDRFWWTDNQAWSYLDRAAALLDNATAVLDLDTGGGERLLELRPHWPAKGCATEAYPPNFSLASQALEPLGAKVFAVASDERVALPFADVSAVVAYIRAIPWVADGFRVDTHLDRLYALQAQVDAGQPLVFSTRSYVIEAHKI